MCRKGHSPLPEHYLRQMARLMQMHKDAHPARIARRYGVTEDFVRQIALEYSPEEMPPLSEALETFYGATIR